MRSAFRSGFGQNSVARLTTRELGKHRVVSLHPQKLLLFCTHTVIFGQKIGKSEQHDELEMSAMASMKFCVSGSWYLHTNSKRYLGI